MDVANKFIIHGLSEEGKAYRAALVAIQELHVKRKIIDGRTYLEFCGHCKYQWPCDTRKLANEGLDRMARTNQGENK